ncbi:MAG: glycosyl transferase family 2 [Neisseria sp.]|nr:glycosyl transferase family 2 [Neisseria sp.]
MNTQKPGHWARQKERGTPFVLTIATLLVRHLPHFLMAPCTQIIVLYFYLTAPAQRRNIARYQSRLKAARPETRLPRRFGVFRQFVAFGELVCDRLAVWQGKIRYEDLTVEDPDGISQEVERGGRGQMLVCSHLGNVEVCRALVSHHKGFKLNVLVHSSHIEVLNGALRKLGADEIQLIQVTDLDAAAMMELHRKIEAGEWIAIAADREPLRGGKTVAVDFLGHRADLPQGAWLLANLLKVKVNTVFCLRRGGRRHLKLRRFLDDTGWKRGQRQEAVAAAAQKFADLMADECALYPLQWFNFFDFWKDGRHG